MQDKIGLKPTETEYDEASFENVYKTYYAGCLHFIHTKYPKLRDEEVEDICSETMMKAFRSYSRFDPKLGNITSWLFTIAVNTAKDYYEASKKRPVSNLSVPAGNEDDNKDGYETDVVDLDAMTPIELILEEEKLAKKNANIDKLPEDDRRIIQMRDDNIPYKEISHLLGMPENTCRTRFRRAVEKLKKMMETSDEL